MDTGAGAQEGHARPAQVRWVGVQGDSEGGQLFWRGCVTHNPFKELCLDGSGKHLKNCGQT